MVQRDARPPFAAIDGAVPPEFSALPTPCYLLDEAALTRNAEILGGLARRTGCKVLLAQKAFSNYDLYPLLAPHLAGTEASGLFEARLGAEEMPSKEVHVFCAAYRADEMEELLQYADHIVFNSPAQLAKFGPAAKAAGKSVGLRINPECSTQDGHAIYDPCAPGSRLGTTRAQWDAAVAADPALPALLDGLHFHTLCEQDADALAVTLDAAADKFGDLLSKMQWLNFGGGHHITRPGYNMTTLERCIRRAHQDWGVTVYLEPGEACALNAGYLLTRVLDVVQNGDTTIAILVPVPPAICRMSLRCPTARRCWARENPVKKHALCALQARPALRGTSSAITALTPCPPWEICWFLAIWRFIPPAKTTPSTVCHCPPSTPAGLTVQHGKSQPLGTAISNIGLENDWSTSYGSSA